MKPHSDTTPACHEAQEKWDLMHTFSYAYICQPPAEWDGEEFELQREALFAIVGPTVHKTDWKSIYSRYSDYIVIRLAFRDARDYYQAKSNGLSTPAYERIRGYAERMDKERYAMRSNPVVVEEIKKPKKKRK
jgi:hypothetical protein